MISPLRDRGPFPRAVDGEQAAHSRTRGREGTGNSCMGKGSFGWGGILKVVSWLFCLWNVKKEFRSPFQELM